MATPTLSEPVDRPGSPPGEAPTPLRALGVPDAAGYRVLRDPGSRYRDGGETEVLRLLRTASDLRSDSDDLVSRAQGWAQRYHLDPARANVIRALHLAHDARVLEVGAGCGAISRYLGETCALVDAVEPVPVRAAAAAARTADQANVEVFVGEVTDVPDEPVYDVVIVIGVLEYVGGGSGEPGPYREFLHTIARRLAPGGTLVLGIENQLGVKYLVGAPEDHTDRVFDSIESYPQGGRARTFDRRSLEALLRESGLHPRTLGAFPDYKMTRAVLGDFPAGAESLLYRIPRFPSPDWRSARPRLADERLVWQALVRAGVAQDFCNSFVVLAGKESPSTLWPAERCAVFYSVGRRPELTAETVVERQGQAVVFHRRPLTPGAARSGRLDLVGGTAPFRPGVDLPRVVADVGLAGAQPYLDSWLGLLDSALQRGDGTAFDVVPHNLVLSDDGALHPIDDELRVAGASRDQIIRRGIFLLAKDATAISPPARWSPCTTIGDVMTALGAMVGLPPDGSWIAEHVAEETDLQVEARGRRPPTSSESEWKQTIERGIASTVTHKLAWLPGGERLPVRAARTETRCRALQADLTARTAELAAAHARVQQAENELAQVKAALARSRTAPNRSGTALAQVRAALPGAARRLGGRLLPRGTRRRSAAERLIRLSARLKRPSAPGAA